MGAIITAILAVLLVAAVSVERLMLGRVGPENVAVWVSGLIVVACVVTGRWFTLTARAVAAAAVSLLTTIGIVIVGPIEHSWGLGESVALGILLAQVIRTLPARRAALLGGALGAAAIVAPVRDEHVGPIATVVGVVTLGVALAFAYIRILDQQRAVEIAETRSRERLEIARELHDLVAQHISGIMILIRGVRADPSRTSRTLDEIETAGAQAMAAMRRLVKLLRDEGTPRLDPAPELARLEADAELLRHKGLRVDMEVAEPLRHNLPVGVYRIVRETLTNVGKHAHGATRATVRVKQAAGGGIDIEVTDDGHPDPQAKPGNGFGLVGLRERLEELGGTLQSGPIEPHGWRVRAHLPPEGPPPA